MDNTSSDQSYYTCKSSSNQRVVEEPSQGRNGALEHINQSKPLMERQSPVIITSQLLAKDEEPFLSLGDNSKSLQSELQECVDAPHPDEQSAGPSKESFDEESKDEPPTSSNAAIQRMGCNFQPGFAQICSWIKVQSNQHVVPAYVSAKSEFPMQQGSYSSLSDSLSESSASKSEQSQSQPLALESQQSQIQLGAQPLLWLKRGIDRLNLINSTAVSIIPQSTHLRKLLMLRNSLRVVNNVEVQVEQIQQEPSPQSYDEEDREDEEYEDGEDEEDEDEDREDEEYEDGEDEEDEDGEDEEYEDGEDEEDEDGEEEDEEGGASSIQSSMIESEYHYVIGEDTETLDNDFLTPDEHCQLIITSQKPSSTILYVSRSIFNPIAVRRTFDH